MRSKPKVRYVFDAHTHIFPDAIAVKARKSVSDFYQLPMYTTGTYAELRKLRDTDSDRWKIIGQLVCSPAAIPSQTHAINTFIASLCRKDPRLIGFGTLHRDNDNYMEELDWIQNAGLLGVKFHCDFQQFPIDDRKMFAVYQEAANRGLPVLFHMGDQNLDYSSPKRLKNVLDEIPSLTVIAAHMGGYQHWEEAMHLPASDHLFFDLSSTLAFIHKNQLQGMLNKFGESHFFFGSDFPMWNPFIELEVLEQMGFSEELLEKIEYKNFINFLKWRIK